MKEYLIDTHAHIDMLEAPIESTLQLMKDFGAKKAVIPSVEVSSMEKVIAAAEADENIYAMIGIYPSEAKTYTQEVEDRDRNSTRLNSSHRSLSRMPSST